MLVAWLEQLPGRGRPGLVIGCGRGDDAEELRRRVYRVRALDYSTSAIDWCRAVAPGGRIFLRCLGRADDEAVTDRPWAVSRRDLGAFAAAGLREIAFTKGLGSTGRPAFQVTYQR